MSYMSAMAPCVGCDQIFSFNPTRVPSCQGKPICLDCVNRVNPVRVKNGLDPIRPLAGAYSAEQVTWN